MADQFTVVCDAVARVTGRQPLNAGKDRRKGLCPAHDDAKESLSLRKDTERGKIGVTCFAGCKFEEIAEALDLTARDFLLGGPGKARRRPPIAASTSDTSRREPKGDPEGKEVARYAYRDEDGKALYYNIRYEPKDFRLADRNGKRANLPRNMRWVPYRLPEVLQAVAEGRVIYWVEGEKDVDNLWDRGEAATTNAGGSNRPLDPEWADYFEGAHVVIVCDRDKPGRAYGRAVARLLVNKAHRIEITQSATPQTKSDVSDHLQAGYQLSQLEELPMRSVRRTRWTVAAIMDTKPEPLRWVLPGMIPEGLTLLVGAPKVGKSWWNINLMAALGSGRPDEVFGWGQQVDPSPNLYLALEDPHRRVYSRMHQVTRGLQFPRHLAGEVWLDLEAIEKGGKDEIERWLDNQPDARVVLVDVLAKVRGGGDESGGMYQADYAAVSILKDIADDYGIGVVVTHHDRKKTDEDFLNMVSGTKGVTGAADTILYLTRERGSTSGLLRVESRDVEECQYRMEFQKTAGRWHVVAKEDLGQDAEELPKVDLLFQIEQTLNTLGQARVIKIADILGAPTEEVERECRRGEERGILIQTNDGRWHSVHK